MAHHWSPNGPFDHWWLPDKGTGQRSPGSGPTDATLRTLKQRLEASRSSNDRVVNVENLVDADNRQPWSLVRQAEVYSLFHNPIGAFLCAQRAYETLKHVSPGAHDSAFEQWNRTLHDAAAKYEKEQHDAYQRISSQPGVTHALDVAAIERYTTAEPDAKAVRTHWQQLEKAISPKVLDAYFARELAGETSQLEDVFGLLDNSLPRLVRAGFHLGAIERFKRTSGVENRTGIVHVLADFQNALLALSRHWSNRIDGPLVYAIHRELVRSTRIQTEGHVEVMVPVNEWRHIPVYVGGPPVLLFPDPVKVPAAMEAFFKFASAVLQHHNNRPYTASAWLHHALVSVHPFRDGNGRTTRLIASIPLMLNNLPPINIASEDRLNYRNALAAADHPNRDIRPLASFLRDQAVKTIQKLDQVHRDAPRDPHQDINAPWSPPDVEMSEADIARTGPITLPGHHLG